MSAQPKCQACKQRIKASEASLFTQMGDGSRTYIHIICLRKEPTANAA